VLPPIFAVVNIAWENITRENCQLLVPPRFFQKLYFPLSDLSKQD